MNRLPRELVDAILWRCVAQESKNQVLVLRLVCRFFDRALKPYVCRTLGLDFSRLSRQSGFRLPEVDALQTIGHHCKSLYVDLMVLRDEMEVEFLETVFARIPSMTKFCRKLQHKYCLNQSSFTEMDFFETLEAMLFNCRRVDRLRLNLPFQLVGHHVNAATMILANTLKAFAGRPEEDSAELKALVLENVTDIAICHLWMNPSDVMNIMTVLAPVRHLVLTLRRHENEALRVGWFGSCLWNLIENAERLESLCLIGMDHEDKPPRGLRQTRFTQVPVDEWRARSLPAPRIYLASLTCLELKRIEILPEAFLKIVEDVGKSLEELYLNEVFLKTEQSGDWNQDSQKVLWVGVPNTRPPEDCYWMAMAVRAAAPLLRTCRASFLAYDQYLGDETGPVAAFDLDDPCHLSRSLSQRFVEVVGGIPQPAVPSSPDAVEYLPRDSRDDHLVARPPPQPTAVSPQPSVSKNAPRRSALRVEEYDANAYQTAVANPTSKWQKSIDGLFANCNSNTLDELHYIAETACRGMNEIHRRRNEWASGGSTANEYADNLLSQLPPPPGAGGDDGPLQEPQ
ncbi:hypothetical protein RJ55_00445 [Drechmeria coniospora]|nr:hypothetical protein RJ55_00445 [Drechmeria coniospora]